MYATVAKPNFRLTQGSYPDSQRRRGDAAADERESMLVAAANRLQHTHHQTNKVYMPRTRQAVSLPPHFGWSGCQSHWVRSWWQPC